MVKKGILNTKSGFTIIEVTLVIAIVGLIFLMIFVAIPGLSVSQRDAARREDLLKLVSNIKSYQTNNRQALPITAYELDGTEMVSWDDKWGAASFDSNSIDGWKYFYYKYLGENFIDPDGSGYQLKITSCNMNDDRVLPSTLDVECGTTASGGVASMADATFPNDHTISIVLGAKCRGTEAVVGSSASSNFATLYKLEGAGWYCTDSGSK